MKSKLLGSCMGYLCYLLQRSLVRNIYIAGEQFEVTILPVSNTLPCRFCFQILRFFPSKSSSSSISRAHGQFHLAPLGHDSLTCLLKSTPSSLISNLCLRKHAYSLTLQSRMPLFLLGSVLHFQRTTRTTLASVPLAGRKTPELLRPSQEPITNQVPVHQPIDTPHSSVGKSSFEPQRTIRRE